MGETRNEIAALVGLADAAPQLGESASEKGKATYRFEAISGWPEPARDQTAREFFEKKLGGSNFHLLFHSSPGHSIVAVKIASDKPDRVVDALSKDAKGTAKQCSGTRPAIVAMQLIDPIEHGELRQMLQTPNGLHRIAHEVFKRDARKHVDSIVFTTSGRFEPGAGERRWSGDVLVLHNDKRKYVCDEARSVFRSQPRNNL